MQFQAKQRLINVQTAIICKAFEVQCMCVCVCLYEGY